MHLPRLSALLILGAVLVSPTLTRAYCRTRTVGSTASSCPEACGTKGLPLYWPEPNPTYVFNERGFPGLDDASLRRALSDSFGAWNDITCTESDSPIGLDITAEARTTSLEVGSAPGHPEPNDNVIVYFSGQEWLAQELNSDAYALTAIWYDKKSGHILGADMHFNGGMGQFGECPASGCDAQSGLVDLRNVATHEAGHFIGLAHSAVPNSTMWCSADPDEVVKRSLAKDDVAGACAIYEGAFDSHPSTNTNSGGGGGCSLRGGGAGVEWPLGAIGLLGVVRLLSRRRRIR